MPEPAPFVFYNDDRLFVLDINIAERSRFEGHIESVLQAHIDESKDLVWTLTTRRNHTSLPPSRFDHFDTLEELLEYLREVEPTTPRRSLGGRSPEPTPSYEEYLAWLRGSSLMGAIETKLTLGGYYQVSEWRPKLRQEAESLAECLGVDLPEWD